MKAIGLDIGTTTISAVVMEQRTRFAVQTRTVANQSFLKTARSWEKLQDASVILKQAKELLDQLLDAADDICVIGLTGQMHGIVYLDRNGACISPLYTWEDERAEQKCFAGRSLCQLLKEQYGVSAHTGYGLITHCFHTMTQSVPDGACRICTIADYIGMQLTGRKQPLVHASNAASLGLYRTEAGCFDTQTIASLHMDVSILPAITEQFALLGTYRGIPVCTAIGDNQASFLGAVEDPAHTILVNMGTGGQISAFSPSFFDSEEVETRPLWPGGYLLVGSVLCGGRAYALLKDFFAAYGRAMGVPEADHYEIMRRLLEKGRPTRERLVVDSRFAGTRQEPARRGAVTNIGVDNFTPESLIYGVLDGIVEEVYQLYQKIEPGLPEKVTKIVASGNGLRKNEALQRILGTRFALPVEVAAQEEEAACGAAIAGLTAVEA